MNIMSSTRISPNIKTRSITMQMTLIETAVANETRRDGALLDLWRSARPLSGAPENDNFVLMPRDDDDASQFETSETDRSKECNRKSILSNAIYPRCPNKFREAHVLNKHSMFHSVVRHLNRRIPRRNPTAPANCARIVESAQSAIDSNFKPARAEEIISA